MAFEGISPGASGSQSVQTTSMSTNTNPVDVLSVNELLESVNILYIHLVLHPISIGLLCDPFFHFGGV